MSSLDSGNLKAWLTAQTTTHDVAEFMSRVVPWPEAANSGVVNLHWRAKNPQSGNFFWGGRPHNTVASFVDLTKWAVGKPTIITDIYFCLSLQSQVGKYSRGKLTVARSKENALALKSIWLDIDVKDPPKGYATRDDALRALDLFVKSASLPFPTCIVGSGGGLHVYWISEKPLTVEEWRPYADGLKAGAIKFGLRCDAGLTTDCARILRVPDTFNYKTDPPKRVEILYLASEDYDFSVALADLTLVGATFTATANSKIAPKFDLNAFAGKKPAAAFAALNSFDDHLSDGLGFDDKQLDPRPVIRECPFFKDAFKTHGKDHTQPLWNLTILATTFWQKGEVFAHELGNGHPGYTPQSTDAMYARKLKERTQKGLGWPSCKAIESEGCKLCTGCQHYGKFKSPLNLHKIPQATAFQTSPAPVEQISFVDPYAEFVGPKFPMELLPPTIAKFVDAEHRAMGADISALAIAALTTIAGALHAETRIQAGEGWWERPILWAALVGTPSTMKSPIISKATKPLRSIDHERQKQWAQEYAKCQQSNQK